ncbi:TonB-dependent receptor domain-containing protein [Nguyenibacter sp. L1]|uniref:TonB-dependent receptor n=1 Tax=Nguyenibacter sp. L1 TaxID=3049350 RepID=UPI002B4753F9|nr:TonB-dependent receptor [Nguyenibacter sp. L1]WRH88841.1 TonB-dependent receptor [Nguyenibacter sp. L1]
MMWSYRYLGRFFLVSSTALVAFHCDMAAAAHAKKSVQRFTAGPKAASHPLSGRQVSRPEELQVSGSVHAVKGGGAVLITSAPKNIEGVSRDYISRQSGASTAVDLIKYQPSINASTTDSSGMIGGQLISRGLTDSDMAITVDGIAPNSGAGHATQNFETEDTESVQYTPGPVDLALPITSAAIGGLEQSPIMPSSKRGGFTDFSYGTNNLSREYIRLESGEIGNSGIKAFYSMSHAHARNWQGAGTGNRIHMDFGAYAPIGQSSFVRPLVSWNYQSPVAVLRFPTAAQFHEDKNNLLLTDSYHLVSTYNPQDPNLYFATNQYRYNQLQADMPTHLKMASFLDIDIKPYLAYQSGHWNPGGGALIGPTAAVGGKVVPLSVGESGSLLASAIPGAATWNNSGPKGGVVAETTWHLGKKLNINAGYWYEQYHDNVHWVESALNTDGDVAKPDNVGRLLYVRDGSGAYRYTFDVNHASSIINAGFVQGKWTGLNDRLDIEGGVKVVHEILSNAQVSNGTMTTQSVTSPLPQLLMSYKLDSENQIYINGSGNFRLPDPGSLATYYDASTGHYVGSQSNLKPEYVISEELGFRHSGKYLYASVELFNYAITNRLLSTNVSLNGTAVAETLNAGNQTSRGVDVMLSGRRTYGFTPYVSFEYLHATEDTNLQTTAENGRTDYLRTNGKEAVQAPHYTANFGINYDRGMFFGDFGLHYTSSQWASFMNDEKMPDYFTNSLGIGVRFKGVGFFKNPVFKLNANNLTGAFLRTGVASVVNNARETLGVYGNAIASSGGATYYLYPRFNITGTISSSF